jgi:hypothetical protein
VTSVSSKRTRSLDFDAYEITDFYPFLEEFSGLRSGASASQQAEGSSVNRSCEPIRWEAPNPCRIEGTQIDSLYVSTGACDPAVDCR